jgi:hypothetical protein
LNELAKILTADNADLYEKLVKDLGETGTKFQNWWDRCEVNPESWTQLKGSLHCTDVVPRRDFIILQKPDGCMD